MLWVCGDGELIFAPDEVGKAGAAHAHLLKCDYVGEWFVDVPEGGAVGDRHGCGIRMEGVGCVKELNGECCGGLDPVGKKSRVGKHWEMQR